MRAYDEKINKILQETFFSDWRRFKPGQLRLTKSKKGVIPYEGDLVLIRADNLCDPGKYGVVEKCLALKPGLQKVGIRGIQIRAKFKILGAKIVAGPKAQPHYWFSEPDQRSWSQY